VMSGLPAGGVLDVDADSDYGSAFGGFLEEYGGAVNRHTTVIVLGDGRGNGNDPNFGAIAEIARRARATRGRWAPATCPATRPTATGCTWSGTCPAWTG
jgi:uncharacterized protein with von Willebrand factor type A (vWA) domain